MRKTFILFYVICASLTVYGENFNDRIKQAKLLLETKKYELAFKQFHNMAEEGSLESQCYIGCLYYLGYGVKQNYKLAIRWLEKSAGNGYAESSYYLGLIYLWGIGAEKNSRLAIRFLEAAAQNNIIKAQIDLANLYKEGGVIEKDEKMAIYWFKKAIETNKPDPVAQRNLGVIYLNQADKNNYKLGLSLLLKAAKQNESGAQFILSQIYIRLGKTTEALKSLVHSAENGAMEAELILGILCVSVNKNFLAEKWFNLAQIKLKKTLSINKFYHLGNEISESTELNEKIKLSFIYVQQQIKPLYPQNMFDKANLGLEQTIDKCDKKLIADTINTLMSNNTMKDTTRHMNEK